MPPIEFIMSMVYLVYIMKFLELCECMIYLKSNKDMRNSPPNSKD